MHNEQFHMKTIFSAAILVAASAVLLFAAPVYASAADDQIESSVKESYIFKNYLQDDAIQVDSQDGVVTLTGSVAQEPHKGLAMETAASLPGVKRVDNQLVVQEATAAGSADGLVRERVRLELWSHRNLRAANLGFEVNNGVVSVHGEASSQAQIDLITEYIKDVDGVSDVQNDMVVANAGKSMGDTIEDLGASIDDASITALVKATLLYHRSTSAINTRVETANGMVSLSGTAKSAAARDLATKFARDVHGVKSVTNFMVLEKMAAGEK